MKTSEKIVYALLLLVLVMVNPPILGWINAYAKDSPFVFGYPTLWVWLQFWYAFGIAVFLFGALRIKDWNREYPEVTRK